MSSVKANNLQIGQSATATNNATWYQPSTPDGTVRLGVGNAGATTADVITASSTGVTIPSVSSNNTFGFKNRIINGGMVIDQRNAGASVTPANGDYTLDRWQALASQSGKYTVQQVTSAPTGYKNSLKVTSTGAYSVLSTDRFMIRQLIEGNNFYDFAWGTASGFAATVSFWVQSSLTGTFGGSIASDAGDASYPFSYTISAANTWELKTISVPSTALGTWRTTNSAAVQVEFGFGVGSSRSGTANTWSSSIYDAPTGATSVVGTNGATFYITGVQLEVGSQATSFDFRSYGQELALCQRYYCKFIADSTGYSVFASTVVVNSTDAYQAPMVLPVQMRAAPTITYSTLRIFDGSGYPSVTSSYDNRSSTTQISISYQATGGGLTAGRACVIQANGSANAYIAASSEI